MGALIDYNVHCLLTDLAHRNEPGPLPSGNCGRQWHTGWSMGSQDDVLNSETNSAVHVALYKLHNILDMCVCKVNLVVTQSFRCVKLLKKKKSITFRTTELAYE